MKNLNEQVSRIKGIMGVIDEQGMAGGMATNASSQSSGGQTYSGNPTPAAAKPAAPQIATIDTNGWWTKHSALLAYMKDTANVAQNFFPPVAQKDTGCVVAKKTNGAFWGFFADGKFYIYDNQDNALKGVNWKWNGTWKGKGNVLYLATNDGERWNSSSKKWVKPLQWVKETGTFPLKYLQFGPTIKALQLALGLKGDSYFGPVTEKYVLAKAPEYKRETGVTNDIYNKIVNAAKPAQATAPATQATTTSTPPPTEAELQANPNTLNPY
jgi:hypothetical protein